jgi:S-methylmethionine-dependent homocysteine/selenocysteine methylase
VILLDGPMGTELARRGVPTPAPGWSAYALETHPEIVAEIHREYAEAGAIVHRTNTFRTQVRVFPDRYRELASKAIELARAGISAAGPIPGARRGDVTGSMAPIMDCYRPDLSPAADIARAEHGANALALDDVDQVICEAFPHGGEAAIAVEEATRVGQVLVALTAGPDGSLMTPEEMERAAIECVAAGACAVLVNCTAATKTLPYVKRLARVGVPFGAYANAGDPNEGLGWGAEGAAERYADIAATWLDEGAMFVGACCGCGPAHIRALHDRLSSRYPAVPPWFEG